MRFKNKICLVSGGDSGIGKACSVRLAAEGGTVAVIARNEEAGNSIVNEIIKDGGKAFFKKVDVSNPDEVKLCVEEIRRDYNKIDVIVNDAAMMTFKKITDLEVEEWDKVINVNLRSAFLFCKYSLPHMQNGAVVNISSVHAFETESTVLPYAASKGGIEAFTRGLSREYEPSQARFNCVAPGSVNTPMLWDNPKVKKGEEKIDDKKLGQPEDIAAAVCFLASEEAKFINGTTLVADGGKLAVL